MDFSHRNNLRYCRQKIVEDLDVLDIIDNLIENEILDDETQERIMSERTRRDRVRALLDTLPTRGPRAYKVFIGALERDYAWLAEVNAGIIAVFVFCLHLWSFYITCQFQIKYSKILTNIPSTILC